MFDYTARITRKNPSAFIFLIDTSGSMEESAQLDDRVMQKSEIVSLQLNTIIGELLTRCKREDGYRDYFEIAALGYGGDKVTSLLPNGLDHNVFIKPSELAQLRTPISKIFKDRSLPDGSVQTMVTEVKNWINSTAIGKTPMFEAMNQAYKLAADWMKRHSDKACFPPIIINITDGEGTDAHPRDLFNIAEKIRSLGKPTGNVLLMNIFITTDTSCQSVLFPTLLEQLPNVPHAKLLFEMSSVMPSIYSDSIVEYATGIKDVSACKAMSYNTSMGDIISMLNIGSISVNLVE